MEPQSAPPETYSQAIGHVVEPGVRGPQTQPLEPCSGQEVNINPPDAAPMKLTVPDERNHVRVRNDPDLSHAVVVAKKLRPLTSVSHQEFAEDERMAHHFLLGQK